MVRLGSTILRSLSSLPGSRCRHVQSQGRGPGAVGQVDTGHQGEGPAGEDPAQDARELLSRTLEPTLVFYILSFFHIPRAFLSLHLPDGVARIICCSFFLLRCTAAPGFETASVSRVAQDL